MASKPKREVSLALGTNSDVDEGLIDVEAIFVRRSRSANAASLNATLEFDEGPNPLGHPHVSVKHHPLEVKTSVVFRSGAPVVVVVELKKRSELSTGMRDFGTMAMEVISIAAPMVRGIVTENWEALPSHESGDRHSKRHVLQLWDDSTPAIDDWWPKITPGRFLEITTAFGQYPGRVYDLLLYAIDNEIHHRGQGYVYLRSLGIEPPPFYERE